MDIQKTIHKAFIVFTIALAFILLLPQIFQEGMFMDGTIYAAIARNLAIGEGSFWFPKFSDTEFVVFHDHPPLAFGLQSLFFNVFGDVFYVERIYGFVMIVITGLLIYLIWKKLFQNTDYVPFFWLPILIWILIPKVFWSYSNNMLENTMTVFSLASIYTLLLGLNQTGFKQLLLLMLTCILLFLSFLSKGFPGLFPLGFLFINYISHSNKYSFKKMLLNSILLLISFIVFVIIFFQLNINAFESIESYFNVQVLNSINGKDRVGSRTQWLFEFFMELLPSIILFFLVFFSKRKLFYEKIKVEKNIISSASLFFLIGLSASLPLSVSPKLSVYYLVPAFPYMAMALSALMLPNLQYYFQHLNIESNGFKIFKLFGVILIPSVITYAFFQFGNKLRDKEILNDIEKVAAVMKKEKILSVAENMYQDWRLIAYFERKAGISINRTTLKSKFLIVEKNEEFSDTAYINTGLILEKFRLYQKE